MSTWLFDLGTTRLKCAPLRPDGGLGEVRAIAHDDAGAWLDALLRAAKERGLEPAMVCFDAWYSGVDNLKEVRRLGWKFHTRFKGNRLVRLDFGP